MRTVAFVVVMLNLAAAAFADPIGRIVYLQGNVQVVRDAEIHSADVDFGFPLQGYDEIVTGEDGTAQISLTTPNGLNADITLQPDSSFYLDMSDVVSAPSDAVELLAGSISLNVQKIESGLVFQVRTENTLMGVRGTQFDVDTSAGGDVLVTVSEGRVECDAAAGGALFADPEHAVENVEASGSATTSAPASFRNLQVTGAALKQFRQDWIDKRRAAFREHAPEIVSAASDRYDQLTARFDTAYAGLMQHRSIIDRWIHDDRIGAKSSGTGANDDLSRINDAFTQVRRLVFRLERLTHRLAMMERVYRSGPRWTDPAGFSSDRFFQKVDNQRPLLLREMRSFRYVMKLYAKRNGGVVPFQGIPANNGE